MKTALITGTGCDIGREVALFLGAKNYKILTHGTEMKETLKNTHQALEDRKRMVDHPLHRHRGIFNAAGPQDPKRQALDEEALYTRGCLIRVFLFLFSSPRPY